MPRTWGIYLHLLAPLLLGAHRDKTIVDKEGWDVLRIRCEKDHLVVHLNGRFPDECLSLQRPVSFSSATCARSPFSSKVRPKRARTSVLQGIGTTVASWGAPG
jgi:hypothetical protein